MFRSLYLKLVLILVLLMISIMAVVGTFLLNSVAVYHLDEFSEQMVTEFSENAEFVAFLRSAADEEDGPSAMNAVLKAYSGNLGVDIYNRNYYILDANTGKYIVGSDNERGAGLELTPNILTAMGGEPGFSRSITSSYIDVAIPISGEENTYIVYILDYKQRQQDLTTEMFIIILESIFFGLAVSVLLSFLLSKTMTTPIENLTRRASAISKGDFSGKIETHSTDEIGVLTSTFNIMAGTLKKTLDTVKNERDKLNTLFIRMTDGVCAFDREGNVTQVNLAALQFFGLPYSEDLTYLDILEDVLPLNEALEIKPQSFFDTNYSVGEMSLKVFIAPFGDNEREGGIMAVIHDITEQTKLDNVRREFVANVSHELRTPLTNVKSYSETLFEKDDIDRETEKEFLNVIMKESDRMSRIVSDLLTLSRFDYGNAQLDISNVQISKLVERVYQAMYLEAVKHNHELSLELKGSIPEIPCDSHKIEQVLVNIVSNAVKYTPDGGRIEVFVWAEAGEVFISVTDNGIGVPEDDVSRIFERFYRVDKARSRDAGGSGLGLTIAQEIVERHGGRITFESNKGQGSTVTIVLPVDGGICEDDQD